MRWHVNVRFILCHQMTKVIIKSYIVYAKKPWNNIHGFSYIYILFSDNDPATPTLQMCVSILSCVNTHDKPAADTYAHSHGYNSLRSLYHDISILIISLCHLTYMIYSPLVYSSIISPTVVRHSPSSLSCFSRSCS